jgi:hypothetical protein
LTDAKPTVYFESNEDRGYYKFNDSKVTFVEISQQDPFARNHEIWVLADDTAPRCLWNGDHDWLIFQTTSPAGNMFRRLSKQTVARVLYMDPWSWLDVIFVG